MTLLRATAPYSACNGTVVCRTLPHSLFWGSKLTRISLDGIQCFIKVKVWPRETVVCAAVRVYGFLSGFLFLYLLMDQVEDCSGYLGPRNFLTWLDYYVLCTCGYMLKELLNKSLSLWFVRETTITYKYRVLYDVGQWPFPLTIWSGFSLIAKCTYMYIAQN